jgi:hypothetical protein
LRLLFSVILTIPLVGLILLGLDDTNIAVADTDVYAIEVYIRPHDAGNSSAGTTITITMTTVADERQYAQLDFLR